jgi:hypothetical protein
MVWLETNALLLVTIGGVLLAWLVYRGGKASQREGVIAALRQELKLHVMWAKGPYTKGVTQPAQEWWRTLSPRGIVFKLTTEATDSAIANGPDLFLNRRILVALVEYRQAVGHLNQLIDRAMLFQANSQLFRLWPSPRIKARMTEVLGAIHYDGIGDDRTEAVHFHHAKLDKELRCEESLRFRVAIWILLGIRSAPRKEC